MEKDLEYIDNKIAWTTPDLFILDFRETKGGPIVNENENTSGSNSTP